MDKLSVIIPARNEVFLDKTVRTVLEAAAEPVEVIAVYDGYEPDPPLPEDPRLVVIRHNEARGQRQSINEAARIAMGKYIMKLDAHCSVAPGFDKVLKQDCKYEWTMVPRMYTLDVVNWKPKLHKKTDYMYISGPEHKKGDQPYGFRAMYYGKYGGAVGRRPRSDKPIDETMCCMGPGWFMWKDRFWELGGCDEGHGGWGQQGIEVALKAWLSGGALTVNKRTWFAHWFRGGGVPEGLQKGFPYSISYRDQERARKYSRDLWLNNKWEKQTRTIEWLVEKFRPPTWAHRKADTTIIYYTDNTLEPTLDKKVQDHLVKAADGKPIISVSQKPVKLGTNICVGDIGRSHHSMYRQILEGAKAAQTRFVALAEHDCFYSSEHFNWTPHRDDTFYYNLNHWFVDWNGAHDGRYSYSYRRRLALSNLVCNRELLIEALGSRIRLIENGHSLIRGLPGACEPGVLLESEAFTGAPTGGKKHRAEGFRTETPNLDIRHGGNFSGRRKGKNRRYSLAPWGSFHALVGVPPPGSWYQEATILGRKMPTRRRNDPSEGRWEKFILPHLHSASGVFLDLGCNAGLYCRKATELGFRAIGVERDTTFIRHAHYWESCEPKGVQIIESDIMDVDIPTADVAVIANVHYWLTDEQLNVLEKRLREKVKRLIVIGRKRPARAHASDATYKPLLKRFRWWIHGSVKMDGKHFSTTFINPELGELVTLKVDDIFPAQQLAKSRRFFPAFSKMVDTGDESEYVDYLKWRRFPADRMLKEKRALIADVKAHGIKLPLIMENARVVDGDHRLIIAKTLGMTDIPVRR